MNTEKIKGYQNDVMQSERNRVSVSDRFWLSEIALQLSLIKDKIELLTNPIHVIKKDKA